MNPKSVCLPLAPDPATSPPANSHMLPGPSEPPSPPLPAPCRAVCPEALLGPAPGQLSLELLLGASMLFSPQQIVSPRGLPGSTPHLLLRPSQRISVPMVPPLPLHVLPCIVSNRRTSFSNIVSVPLLITSLLYYRSEFRGMRSRDCYFPTIQNRAWHETDTQQIFVA